MTNRRGEDGGEIRRGEERGARRSRGALLWGRWAVRERYGGGRTEVSRLNGVTERWEEGDKCQEAEEWNMVRGRDRVD